MPRAMSDYELKEWLQRLCEDEALELIPGKAGVLYIPLIMNDAAEVYCKLTDAVVPGQLPDDLSDVTQAELVSGDTRRGLLLKTDESIKATIWFDHCLYEETLYQYHRIMHRWVKNNEHMRMLVYMIGTMRDKYEYLGDAACNDQEKALIPLMEYRPFRSFSPIDESLDAWYPDTALGYESMRKLAQEAGDAKLLRLMKMGKVSGHLLDQKISRYMSCSQPLFSLIYEKVCSASTGYRQRNYADELQSDLKLRREDIHHRFTQASFTGTYPVYTHGHLQVTVFEEHPFTIPEMDEMAFDVHFLVCDHQNRKSPYRAMDLEEFFLSAQK